MCKQEVMSQILQRVGGPVLVVPAQEPARKGGRFESLFDHHDGCP